MKSSFSHRIVSRIWNLRDVGCSWSHNGKIILRKHDYIKFLKGLSLLLVMITWKYLVPKHASKKVDEENKTKNPDIQNMVPPKIHLNNNVIAEEDEEEAERENNKEDEIKEFGRKLIIYDDN